MWGVASVRTRRGEWHESEGGYCEGAWGASAESIGRFAKIVFATPMALVITMRTRSRALEPVSLPEKMDGWIYSTLPRMDKLDYFLLNFSWIPRT